MLLLQKRSLFTEKCFGKMTNGRFLVPRPPRTNRHVVLDVNKKCQGFSWVRTRVKLTWIYLWLKCHKNSRHTIVSLQTRIVVDLCKRWNLVARYGVFSWLHSGIGFLTRQKQLKLGLLLLNLRLFVLIYCRISGIMFLPVFAVALLCQTATSFSIFR